MVPVVELFILRQGRQVRPCAKGTVLLARFQNIY
jgi:hypothetical protein